MKNKKYIDIYNIDIPKKYKFIKPNFKAAFNLSKAYKPFIHLTETKFEQRCERGKKTTIKKIGLNNIKNAYTHINQVVPWKLIKLKEEVSSNPYNTINMPIIVKIDKKEYYVVDGNTAVGLFTYFKKDVDVWLLDESLETQDFKKRIKEKVIEYTPNYDYGSISQEDKALVKEITILLEKENQNALAEQLKLTFGLKDVEKYNIDNSPFYQICKELNLPLQSQGTIKVSENGKVIEYPMVSICDDIRRLNKIIEYVISKYGNLPK